MSLMATQSVTGGHSQFWKLSFQVMYNFLKFFYRKNHAAYSVKICTVDVK